jgi:alpha-tubulin suppressor-like RCC1 family protein
MRRIKWTPVIVTMMIIALAMTLSYVGCGGSSSSGSSATTTTGPLKWANFSAGDYHSVAVKTDGSLWAWGYNDDGELGDGTTDYSYDPILISATGWAGATLAAGDYHTTVAKADGSLWGWGYNGYGDVGDGTTTDVTTGPKLISATGWAGATIAARYYHTIAIKADGSLWAWGYNGDGELGDNSTTNVTTGPKLISATGWAGSKIAAGWYHTRVLKADGSLWGWGYNYYGELGDGTTTDKLVPTRIGTDTDWSAIAAGEYFTLGVKTDGSLWAWGYNGYGQLGYGFTDSVTTGPICISETGWANVAAGEYHSVGLTADGAVWAWGYNDSFQLGDGTAIDSYIPVRVNKSKLVGPGQGLVTIKSPSSVIYTFTNTSFGATGAIQTFTVPVNGTYQIEAWGADGGQGEYGTPGVGARMRGDFVLTAGTQLKILVGQKGGDDDGVKGYGAGSGGGTFVVNSNVPLIVAGGGGGSGYSDTYDGMNGSTSTSGTGGNGGYAGGTDGSGGEGSGSTSDWGGPGGAGFSGNGGVGYDQVTDPQSFLNGGKGGIGYGADGGFGGGGNSGGGAGGGGGYSGGGGANDYEGGGGGGSYNAGTNQSNSSGIARESNSYFTDAVMIAAGYESSYAMKSDGTLWGWGYNSDGEMGNGTDVNQNAPGQIISPEVDLTLAGSVGS